MCHERTHCHAQLVGMLASRPSEQWNNHSCLLWCHIIACRGERDECGPVHIVIGDGGNREGLADTYDEPQPEWSRYREASYGSGTLDLLNTTHALWRWHRNQDSQAVVSDEVCADYATVIHPNEEARSCCLRLHRVCTLGRSRCFMLKHYRHRPNCIR